MPTPNYPLSERSSELNCFSSDFHHKLPFRHFAVSGSRASRSSSVSSATGSVFSDVSFASSVTSYCGLPYAYASDIENTDYSDDESFIVDETLRTDEAQAPQYELQSKNRIEDTALTLGPDAPFDPQSRMGSPTDGEDCPTPGPLWANSVPSLALHAVHHAKHACDGVRSCLEHVQGCGQECGGAAHLIAAPPPHEYISYLPVAENCSDTGFLRQEHHGSTTQCASHKPVCSDIQDSTRRPHFATKILQPTGLPINGRTTQIVDAPKISETSQGLQRLSSNPRRTKTDATWCKPPLVRQEIRKRSYVQNLIDVAVSLIAHIWPASERPLQVHNSTTGTTVIDLHYFVEQILRRSYASHSTLQLALYYCCKLLWSGELPQRSHKIKSQTNSKRDLPLLCGRRMFLASLMLAFKFLQDRNYSSRAWSTISGLSIADINQNEFRLLEALQYRTFVNSESYHRWQKVVEAQADQMKTHGSSSWRRTMSLWGSAPYNIGALPVVNIPDRSVQTIVAEATSSEREEDHKMLLPCNKLSTPPDSSPPEAAAVNVNRLKTFGADVELSAALVEAKPRNWGAVCSAPVSTMEDMAACISLPHSPGDMGPIAPPAPHLGTVTPPESSPDQAGQCADLIRIIKSTITDHDSGYDSSSPRSNCSEQFENSQMALEQSHLPVEAGDQWSNVVVELDSCLASEQTCLQEAVRNGLCYETDRTQTEMAACDRILSSLDTSEVPWHVDAGSLIEGGDAHAGGGCDEGYESEDSSIPLSGDRLSTGYSVDTAPSVVIGDCPAPDIDDRNISTDELYDDYDLEQHENDMDDGKGLRQHKSKKHTGPPHGKRFYTLAQASQKRSHEKACGQTLASSQHKTSKKSKKSKIGPR